ncbi:unnamed protein product, partial [Protopolystoma xenopodis]
MITKEISAESKVVSSALTDGLLCALGVEPVVERLGSLLIRRAAIWRRSRPRCLQGRRAAGAGRSGLSTEACRPLAAFSLPLLSANSTRSAACPARDMLKPCTQPARIQTGRQSGGQSGGQAVDRRWTGGGQERRPSGARRRARTRVHTRRDSQSHVGTRPATLTHQDRTHRHTDSRLAVARAWVPRADVAPTGRARLGPAWRAKSPAHRADHAFFSGPLRTHLDPPPPPPPSYRSGRPGLCSVSCVGAPSETVRQSPVSGALTTCGVYLHVLVCTSALWRDDFNPFVH